MSTRGSRKADERQPSFKIHSEVTGNDVGPRRGGENRDSASDRRRDTYKRHPTGIYTALNFKDVNIRPLLTIVLFLPVSRCFRLWSFEKAWDGIMLTADLNVFQGSYRKLHHKLMLCCEVLKEAVIPNSLWWRLFKICASILATLRKATICF